MDVTAFTRYLYKTRELTIRSYMRVPTVGGGKSALTITTTPVVYFGYNAKDMGKADDNTFKMNPRNQLRVTQLFARAVEWLNPNIYQDLFIQDEHDGRLMVNMEYQKLNAIARSNSRYDSWQALLSVPMVVTYDGKQIPGIALSINRTNYTVPLTEDDVAAIYCILNTFSFQTETTLLAGLGMSRELWDSTEYKVVPSTSSSSGFGSADRAAPVKW